MKTPIIVDSSDDLASVPSDKEEETPVTNKRIKRRRPSKAITPNPMPEIPDLPADNLDAASALAVHRTFARQLQARLEDFDTKFRASQEAHSETMSSAQEVKLAVDDWIQAWTSGR
jgi:hypothetical protein